MASNKAKPKSLKEIGSEAEAMQRQLREKFYELHPDLKPKPVKEEASAR